MVTLYFFGALFTLWIVSPAGQASDVVVYIRMKQNSGLLTSIYFSETMFQSFYRCMCAGRPRCYADYLKQVDDHHVVSKVRYGGLTKESQTSVCLMYTCMLYPNPQYLLCLAQQQNQTFNQNQNQKCSQSFVENQPTICGSACVGFSWGLATEHFTLPQPSLYTQCGTDCICSAPSSPPPTTTTTASETTRTTTTTIIWTSMKALMASLSTSVPSIANSTLVNKTTLSAAKNSLSSPSSTNAAIIAGVLVPLAVIIIAVIILIVYFIRKRQQHTTKESATFSVYHNPTTAIFDRMSENVDDEYLEPVCNHFPVEYSNTKIQNVNIKDGIKDSFSDSELNKFPDNRSNSIENNNENYKNCAAPVNTFECSYANSILGEDKSTYHNADNEYANSTLSEGTNKYHNSVNGNVEIAKESMVLPEYSCIDNVLYENTNGTSNMNSIAKPTSSGKSDTDEGRGIKNTIYNDKVNERVTKSLNMNGFLTSDNKPSSFLTQPIHHQNSVCSLAESSPAEPTTYSLAENLKVDSSVNPTAREKQYEPSLYSMAEEANSKSSVYSMAKESLSTPSVYSVAVSSQEELATKTFDEQPEYEHYYSTAQPSQGNIYDNPVAQIPDSQGSVYSLAQ